jgi:hypothetical protein
VNIKKKIFEKLKHANIHVQSRRGFFLSVDEDEIFFELGDVHTRNLHPILEVSIRNWRGGSNL